MSVPSTPDLMAADAVHKPWQPTATVNALQAAWDDRVHGFTASVVLTDHVTGSTHTMQIVSGSVTIDLDRAPVTEAQVTIPAHALGASPPAWFTPYGVTARVYVGDGTTKLCVLNGPVTTTQYNRPRQTATLTICDASHYLNWWMWPDVTQGPIERTTVANKTTVQDAVKWQCEQLSAESATVQPYAMFAPAKLRWLTTDWANDLPDPISDDFLAAKSAAQFIDYLLGLPTLLMHWLVAPNDDATWGGMGNVTVRDTPIPGSGALYPVALTITKDRLIDYTVTHEQRFTHERMTVTPKFTKNPGQGTGAGDAGLVGNAATSGTGRTSVRHNGRIMHTSQVVKGRKWWQTPSQSDANTWAAINLRSNRTWARTVQLQTPPAAWVFPGDSVVVSAAGINERLTVRTVTLPLTPGPMTLTAQSQSTEGV